MQTAQLFIRGYLGPNASLATIVSVTGKGFPEHLGDTLAPSDMCPNFEDDSGGQQDAWKEIWLPPFIKRLSKYIEGNLTLDESSWMDFPSICGYESQIRGRLSPFCDTFTQSELEQYEYLQDLSNYYGVGPAADVASKMMVPFLASLMDRFVEGPDAEGKDFDGNTFKVPKLLMSFLNDGQLNELAAASGIFDEQADLPTDHIAKDRLWRSSRISPMRGTIAFERLNCTRPGTSQNTRRPDSHAQEPFTSLNEGIFVRIRINEAVYELPSCHSGPGKSCSLKKYIEYISDRLDKQGNFSTICNATDPATPSKVKGASFFTDLAQSHLQAVRP